MRKKIITEESGQALVELSLAAVTLLVLILGIIDYGRAIYDVQVMKNLAGEGSSMASRGAKPAPTTTTVATYAGADLDMAHNGCVIVTVVTNNSGTLAVTDQASYCAKSAAYRGWAPAKAPTPLCLPRHKQH